MSDIDPEEIAFDRVFASAPPAAPPVGFRDGIMRRVRGDAWPMLERAIAAALVLPSLAFLAWETLVEGLDLGAAFENVMSVLAGASDQAFFSVDGLLVVAFALLGVGAVVGSDALLRRT